MLLFCFCNKDDDPGSYIVDVREIFSSLRSVKPYLRIIIMTQVRLNHIMVLCPQRKT